MDGVEGRTTIHQVERKPIVCLLGVPNHMTYAEICQFCGSFIQHISDMQIVRNDGMEDQYSLWIRFDSQESTDYFYKHFNGRGSSSLEVEACRVAFIVEVQYESSIELAQTPLASLIEQSSCPVCLERLDDTTRNLTTICNHSFHFSCISKWTDSSCPVCRYGPQQPGKSICSVCQTSENLLICDACAFIGCGWSKEGHAIRHAEEKQHRYAYLVETENILAGILAPICRLSSNCCHVHHFLQAPPYYPQQPENSICSVCQTSEDLLICLTCGFVGCGKYKEGHAFRHSQETQHCYLRKVEPQVDYVLDNYVHQLIQRKSYGELVNFFLCPRADHDCGRCGCFAESGISEAVLDSEFEAHVESRLQEVKEETERESSKIIRNAEKPQTKLDKCIEEKKFLSDDMNENLLKNQEILKAKIVEIETRQKKALKLKDDKIHDLEEQINENLRKDQEIWKAKIEEIEMREKNALKLKDDKIQGLEKQFHDLIAFNSNLLGALKLKDDKIQAQQEQVRDLMVHLDVSRTVEQSTPNEINGGTVLRIQAESSSAGSNRRSTQKITKKRK